MKAPDKKLKITYIDIDQIKPWEKNPKLHDQAFINKSVDRFGIRQPITVQKGTNRIIVGHGRLEAFRKQGLTKIPVLEWECTDEDATTYSIADNQSTLLEGWDDLKLADILKNLPENDIEFTGLKETYLEKMEIPDLDELINEVDFSPIELPRYITIRFSEDNIQVVNHIKKLWQLLNMDHVHIEGLDDEER